jgi:hypothetical protein
MRFASWLLLLAAGLTLAACSVAPAGGGAGSSASAAAAQPSCLVAPLDGNHTRIEVVGPDSSSDCQTIANTLGSSAWAVVAEQTANPPVFALPSGDKDTVCVGSMGESNYTVIDNSFADGASEVACTELQETAP